MDDLVSEAKSNTVALDYLTSLGFSRDLAAIALFKTDSVPAAADWLRAHGPNFPNTTHRYFLPKRPRLSPDSPDPLARPLSHRMRPRALDEVVGQDHLLGPGSVLRESLRTGRLPSLVLWGPAGTGKTSLARALVWETGERYRFVTLSPVMTGHKEIKEVFVEAVKLQKKHKTVLFVDEVHGFNQAVLDAFLPAIETGVIVFIGTTTENPSLHLTTPMLSRCCVLALKPLKPCHISLLIHRAFNDNERGIVLNIGDTSPISIDDEAVNFLSLHCDGDARVALNALEVATTLAERRTLESGPEGSNMVTVDIEDLKEAMRQKQLANGRAGEEQCSLISALHNSMRGSNADAAIYWLARMLEGGEQPLNIARRLVRFASEDIGLAEPSALGHAVACYQACHFLGLPECDVNLAQCVAYLALAPKSVAAYKGLEAAKKLVRETGGGNVGMPDSQQQSFLPPSLQGRKFLEWSECDEMLQ